MSVERKLSYASLESTEIMNHEKQKKLLLNRYKSDESAEQKFKDDVLNSVC